MTLPDAMATVVYRLPPSRRSRGGPLRPLPDASGRAEAADGIKVLVATRRGQGLRDNDYYGMTDGELVRLDVVCASGKDDDVCGCGRGFAGCQSQRPGTTAAVARWPGSRAEYVDAIADALSDAGYLAPGDPLNLARPVAEELLQLASAFPVGAVLERRLDEVRQRLGA